MGILHHELRNNSVFFKQKTETSLILDTNFTFLRHFNLCFVDIASTNLQYSVVCSYKMQSYIFNTVLQYFSLRLSNDPFKTVSAVQLDKYQTDLHISSWIKPSNDECLSVDFWFFTHFWLFLHVGNIKLFCTSKSQNKNNSVFLYRKPFQILVNFQKSTHNFMSNHG